jgi:hypothetical protein
MHSSTSAHRCAQQQRVIHTRPSATRLSAVRQAVRSAAGKVCVVTGCCDASLVVLPLSCLMCLCWWCAGPGCRAADTVSSSWRQGQRHSRLGPTAAAAAEWSHRLVGRRLWGCRYVCDRGVAGM